MLRKINKKNKNEYYKLINNQITFDKEKYKFFGILKDIKLENKKQLEYISHYNGKVYGYMSILIDIVNERVVNFSLIALEKNKEFFIDLMNFIFSITEVYSNFELRIAEDSPAIKVAEKFFKIYGFKKLGTIEKSKKINDEWHNENIYIYNRR